MVKFRSTQTPSQNTNQKGIVQADKKKFILLSMKETTSACKGDVFVSITHSHLPNPLSNLGNIQNSN